jgi:hypothetical protein
MENYYKNQLTKLKLDGEYPMSLKVYDGNGASTNQMSINSESIPVLIEFLKSLQDGLGDNNKDESYSVVKSTFNSVFEKVR